MNTKNEEHPPGLINIIKEHKFTLITILCFIGVIIGSKTNKDGLLILSAILAVIGLILTMFEMMNSRFYILKYIGFGLFVVYGISEVLRSCNRFI